MMKYTVYKTVNLINGKYYFGVHKTENPNDDYLGSGVYIKRAVAKHGKENFRKDVLFIYLDPESAFGKEDELIRCYRGLDSQCMNLRKGGSGGFDWINSKRNQSWRVRAARKTNRSVALKKRSSTSYAETDKSRRAEHFRYTRTEMHQERARALGRSWAGKKHKLETRLAISVVASRRTGSKNNQFGTRWMSKEGVVQKVTAEKTLELLKQGWVFGRKVQ